VTDPRLMEASEVGAATQAPTLAPTPAPYAGGPVFGMLVEEEEVGQANAVLFAIVGGAVLALCICCVLTEFFVLSRRRARRAMANNRPSLTNEQIRDLMDLEGDKRPPAVSNDEGNDHASNGNGHDEGNNDMSLSPRPPSNAEGDGEFSGLRGQKMHIHLAKSPGEKSGVTLRKVGESLRVEELQEVGFVREWNRQHPDQEVLIGDLVVNVNGTYGNAGRMLREFQLSPMLDVTLERVVVVAQDFEYWDDDREPVHASRAPVMGPVRTVVDAI